MFSRYGRDEGQSQIAPGRDLGPVRQPGQPGRPRTQQPQASPAQPQQQQPQPFAGAQQTLGIGAAMGGGQKPQGMQQMVQGLQGGEMGKMAQPDPGGFAGSPGWMKNAMQGTPQTPMAVPGMQAPGLQAPADAFNPATQGAGSAPQMPPAEQQRQILSGQVGDRAADANSGHDVFDIWKQQYGKGPGHTREENAAALQDFAQFAKQYGFQVNPIEHERMDKVDITTPDGRLLRGVDLIGAAGGAAGQQSWWFGDDGQESGGRGTSPEGGFAQQGGGGAASPFAQYLNPDVMSQAIAASGAPGGQEASERMRQQIMQALQGYQ